jgi:hypothetical protein
VCARWKSILRLTAVRRQTAHSAPCMMHLMLRVLKSWEGKCFVGKRLLKATL